MRDAPRHQRVMSKFLSAPPDRRGEPELAPVPATIPWRGDANTAIESA